MSMKTVTNRTPAGEGTPHHLRASGASEDKSTSLIWWNLRDLAGPGTRYQVDEVIAAWAATGEVESK